MNASDADAIQGVPPLLLQDVRRVVVLWIGRLGDFLITTPFLRAARSRFPSAELVMIVGPKGKEAAQLCPGLDTILEFAPLQSPKSALRVLAGLARRPADLLIDLNSACSRTSALLTRLARARVKLSFEKTSGNGAYTHRIAMPAEHEHMLDRYGRLAEALGAPYEPSLHLQVSETELAHAKELLQEFSLLDAGPLPSIRRPLIAVHPGNFKKFDNRWPEEKFISLTERILKREDARIFYLAGPGEERAVADMVARLSRPIPILPPQPLKLTAAVLSLADLLLVNATGTTHLAVAVGTPTLAFLNRYTKTVWMPRSGHHYSVVSDSWNSCRDITVDAAWSALCGILKTLPRRHLAVSDVNF